MRTLGGMKLQIQILAIVIHNLREHTGEVKVHVNAIGVQNKEMGGNVGDMDEQNRFLEEEQKNYTIHVTFCRIRHRNSIKRMTN
eukprot:UN01658